MEAAGLGLFMIGACVCATLFGKRISSPLLQRSAMGLAMGAVAIGIIYSPWGKQSGAHLNPAVTLTFLRLGKIKSWDAMFYMAAQFVGGLAGVWLAVNALGQSADFATTVPGSRGVGVAFIAEATISFILMSVILRVTNTRITGICAGILIALFIMVEAPLSGMSMNPARTFGSALPADKWTALWIYFTAPPLGMLLAAQSCRQHRGCAKLHHENSKRCIHCGKPEQV